MDCTVGASPNRPGTDSWREEGLRATSRSQAAFLRIALSSASAIRVCHPGPVAFQRAKVSGGRRIEIDVRATPVFGRPRGLSIRLATGAPKISGRISVADFAFANVVFVHSGFSRALRSLVVLRFIKSDLTPVCFAKTDYMDQACTGREDQCVQPTHDQAQRLESTFSVILTDVFDHKRAVPLKILNEFEREAPLGDVPFVLSGVETNGHALVYIRIYVNATVALKLDYFRTDCARPQVDGLGRNVGDLARGVADRQGS